MNRTWLQRGLVLIGAVLVVGHLVALAFLGMTMSNWLSGTVLGLVLAVFGGAHLIMAGGSASSGGSRTRQTVFGLISLTVGVGEGLIALALPSATWWLLVPWVLSALAIGVLLEGSPREKAARLATFGFAAVLVFAGGTVEFEGGLGFAVILGWAVLGALGAMAVGATAHVVRGRLHTAIDRPAATSGM